MKDIHDRISNICERVLQSTDSQKDEMLFEYRNKVIIFKVFRSHSDENPTRYRNGYSSRHCFLRR